VYLLNGFDPAPRLPVAKALSNLLSSLALRRLAFAPASDKKLEGDIQLGQAFTIRVTYNGVIKELQVQPEEDVQAVLERAIKLFSIQQQPHQMGLFTEANVQVAGRPADNSAEIHQSVEKAGLQPDQLLILRQAVVQGGGV